MVAGPVVGCVVTEPVDLIKLIDAAPAVHTAVTEIMRQRGVSAEEAINILTEEVLPEQP